MCIFIFWKLKYKYIFLSNAAKNPAGTKRQMMFPSCLSSSFLEGGQEIKQICANIESHNSIDYDMNSLLRAQAKSWESKKWNRLSALKKAWTRRMSPLGTDALQYGRRCGILEKCMQIKFAQKASKVGKTGWMGTASEEKGRCILQVCENHRWTWENTFQREAQNCKNSRGLLL